MIKCINSFIENRIPIIESSMVMDRLYLDTSVINCLLNDPNCSVITNELLAKYEVFVSVFNIAEIAKTNGYCRRVELIKYTHKLLNGFLPYDMPDEILVRSLLAYKYRDTEINCCIVKDKNWIWDLLCSSPLESDSYEQLIKLKDYSEKWFQDMHNGGRRKMQEIIQNMSLIEQQKITSNFSSFIREMCNNRTDVICYFIKYYIQHNIKEYEIKTDNEARQIIDNLEAWRFYLAGMGYGIYKRSIQETNYSRKRNPGSIDTQQAIYLSICDTFVTNDIEQFKMLKLVSMFGHGRRTILNYSSLITMLGVKF